MEQNYVKNAVFFKSLGLTHPPPLVYSHYRQSIYLFTQREERQRESEGEVSFTTGLYS